MSVLDLSDPQFFDSSESTSQYLFDFSNIIYPHVWNLNVELLPKHDPTAKMLAPYCTVVHGSHFSSRDMVQIESWLVEQSKVYKNISYVSESFIDYKLINISYCFIIPNPIVEEFTNLIYSLPATPFLCEKHIDMQKDDLEAILNGMCAQGYRILVDTYKTTCYVFFADFEEAISFDRRIF